MHQTQGQLTVAGRTSDLRVMHVVAYKSSTWIAQRPKVRVSTGSCQRVARRYMRLTEDQHTAIYVHKGRQQIEI
jgi:hypothetical protein